jgi:hypothetical protein
MSNTPCKLLLILALIAVVTSCSSGSTVRPNSKHLVGESLEGSYAVYGRSEMIGHLKLDNGQYSFTPEKETQAPQDIIDRLYFVKKPKGYYSVKFERSINQDTLLEDIGHLAVLLKIRFSVDLNGLSEVPSLPVDSFLIRNDKKGQQLYFHSIDSEIETWRVTKPWD